MNSGMNSLMLRQTVSFRAALRCQEDNFFNGRIFSGVFGESSAAL